MSKIAVLVSGGVDSSVALSLLKEQSHDLTAFYIKIWLEDELSFLGDCPWEEDLNFAKQVCEQLSVPLKIINLQQEYFDKVIKLSLNQIKQGMTPNPDIFCNSLIKFGAFFDKVDEKFDFVASGHYGKVVRSENSILLKTAPDPIKDQTYFLAKLSKDQLEKLVLPLGDLAKSQVREIAKRLNLPTQSRKDSQGLCFLGKINFNDFLKANLGESPGPIIDFDTNKILGTHQGFWFHTIGQRRGLGLSGGPWYVVSKDCPKNIVYVSKNYFDTEKKRESFYVTDFNWLVTNPKLTNLAVKIRHGESFYQCALEFVEPTLGFVKISGQDQGISAGQFAVFYDNEICLGSAMICDN